MRQRSMGHRASVAAIIAAMLGAGVVTAGLAGSGGSTAPPSTVAVVRTVVTTTASAASAPTSETVTAPRMPDLVGRSLAQARLAVVAAGGSVEVSGGGLFGVIDESAWTVCSTEPDSGSRLDPGQRVVLHVDRSCQ